MSVYASQWFLGLLCSEFPTEIALKVIDFFLLDDFKMVFRIILALLKQAEGISLPREIFNIEKILKMPCENALIWLKSFARETIIDDVFRKSLPPINSTNCLRMR